MICQHCLKDLVETGALHYCTNCKVFYLAEGEETEGVSYYCQTRDEEPEKCDDFVRSVTLSVENVGGDIPEGEDIPTVPTGIDNTRKADKICASCEHQRFIYRD